MRNFGIHASQTVRRPVPRGIANSGPPLLSYGLRPFFLLAGVAACFDMIVWIGALSGYWDVGGPEGPVAWHAHEMLFGYAAAALCGFILTAVPNWTGRLPVSVCRCLGWFCFGSRAACCCWSRPRPAARSASSLIHCFFPPWRSS